MARLAGYVLSLTYIYLQSNVTTGSYITKRSALQYVTDRITTTLYKVTSQLQAALHNNVITLQLHYTTFFAAYHMCSLVMSLFLQYVTVLSIT